MTQTRPRAFHHQRLRMAVKRGDDHLLDRVEDLFVLLEHLLEPAGERADDAIGKQHAEEGPDQRRADHLAEDFRRLVNRAHGFHHAQHRRDDAQRGERIRQRFEIVLRFAQFVEMRLHRIVHHLFDRMRLERAGGYHQQRQRVADQRNERGILEQIGIGAEHGGIFRLLEMAFERHGSIVLEHAHQLRGQGDRIDMVLLVVLGPLENLPEGTADRLQPVERIARDHRADRGAGERGGSGGAEEHRTRGPGAGEQERDDQARQHGVCHRVPQHRLSTEDQE